MGNKQETENINHWSDLAHISEEYDESETGQSIIDRLNSILKLIRVNDKTIIQNLNKKQRNWEVIIKLLSHHNLLIPKLLLQILSYAFVYHETIDFFTLGKTPPELFERLMHIICCLFLSTDTETQMEACKAIEEICFYKIFNTPIINSGIVAALVTNIKDETSNIDKENPSYFRFKEIQKNCLRALVNLLKNDKDDKAKMLLLNLKASNLLVQTLSKTSNLETIKLVSMILSLMAQTSECQEDIIMNSCIEECLKIYRSLDQDDIKIIFIRLIANCSENELGLNKVKRLGVVQIINDEMKDCKNKTLLYHFAMAFLIFSKDVEIYRSLLRTKFLKILENLSFSHVKNDSDVYSLLFGINLFTKRATESNLSELFLVYFNP